MSEYDYYRPIADKILKESRAFTDLKIDCVFSGTREMNRMVRELAEKLSCKHDHYYPEITPDLLIGIKKEDRLEVCMVEIKNKSNVGLNEYSQLVGYLSVSRIIKTGLLVLVPLDSSKPMLSNDFSKLIETGKTSMCWEEKNCGSGDRFEHKVGLLKFIPLNGFIWENTSRSNGISSFDEIFY